jgi:hypothetical protein
VIVFPYPAAEKRGVSRSSRTLAAGCDGRVGFTAQLRGRMKRTRTAKARGPDPPTLQGNRIWIIRRMLWSVAAEVRQGHTTTVPTSILLCSRSDSLGVVWTSKPVRSQAAEKTPEFHMRYPCPTLGSSFADDGLRGDGG